MNLPPPIPDCIQFRVGTNGDPMFQTSDEEWESFGLIRNRPDRWRYYAPLIAAVARFAWWEVARGMCETEFKARNPLQTNWAALREHPAYRAAMDNADAWRTWLKYEIALNGWDKQ